MTSKDRIYSDQDNYYKQLPDCGGRLDRDWNADVKATLRAFDVADTKFVFHSWMRSLRVVYTNVPERPYYENMTADLKEISKLPGIRVLVLCDAEQPWFILGYICAKPLMPHAAPLDPLIVYYCFVKAAYRRKGIGRALMEAVGWDSISRPVICPYWSYVCRELRTQMRLHYNPWVWREGRNGAAQ